MDPEVPALTLLIWTAIILFALVVAIFVLNVLAWLWVDVIMRKIKNRRRRRHHRHYPGEDGFDDLDMKEVDMKVIMDLDGNENRKAGGSSSGTGGDWEQPSTSTMAVSRSSIVQQQQWQPSWKEVHVHPF